MANVIFLDNATNQAYDLGYVGLRLDDINKAAQAVGISIGAVAGALAEENTAYDSKDDALDSYAISNMDSYSGMATLPLVLAGDIGVDAWKVLNANALATTRSHAQWLADFLAVRNFDGAPNVLDKIVHPVLIDVGPANIKIATAIDLVIKYAADYPEQLQGYLSDYALLVNHLINPGNSLTTWLYALYLKEGENWFRDPDKGNAYGGEWDNLPQAFRDALLVSFTNVGQTFFEKKAAEAWRAGHVFEPQPLLGTGGGMNHLFNLEAIDGLLGSSYASETTSLSSFSSMAKMDDACGMAARYALSNLRYVALPELDYTVRNAGGKLDRYDPISGNGSLSEQWIDARSDMLYWSVESLKSGATVIESSTMSEGAIYYDAASKTEITITPIGGAYTFRQYRFGDDAGNILTGGGNDDHLYGMAGNDILSGKEGGDYLEGGQGNDILFGGEDSDILNGGKSHDSYIWNSSSSWLGLLSSNDGYDKIIDTDKKGRILINGSGVGVLIQQSATTWTSVDSKVTLTQGANWVLLIEGGGSLNLGASFNDGDYGIHRLALPTPGGLTLTGDYAPLDGDPSTPNVVDIRYDQLGNLQTDNSKPDPGREDKLYGGSGNDLLKGITGQDILTGNAGNDQIEGGADSDIVMGGEGDDVLYAEAPISLLEALGGGAAAQQMRGDWLDGGDGKDILVSGVAEDLLTGGSGADLLIGGAGNDVLYGDAMQVGAYLDWSVTRQVIPGDGVTIYSVATNQGWVYEDPAQGGDDTLYGGAGSDWMFAGAGNDLLEGGENDDVLFGEAGNDTLIGGTGNDVLVGDSVSIPESLHGSDWLDGGDGDDRLEGGGGDDVLVGGKGKDILIGGKGKDTYIFNAGDGKDDIYDTDTGEEASIIVLGEGVNRNNIRLHKGSMIVDFGDSDALHFTAFDDVDPLGTPLVSSFQFADGYSMSWEELLSRGFDIDGTDGEDILEGTGVEDRIDGKSGDDSIFGLDGSDVIVGGRDQDNLLGGKGDDVYHFELGDSFVDDGIYDAIIDADGVNTVRFGAGISADDLRFQTDGSGKYLIVSYSAQDAFLIEYGMAGRVAAFEFADGRRYSYVDLIQRNNETMLTGTDEQGSPIQFGGHEDEILYSALDHAILSGGPGNDTIIASGANSTVLYNTGDGTDHVMLFGDNSRILFGDGIRPQDLTLTVVNGEVALKVGAVDGDMLLFGVLADDVLGEHTGYLPFSSVAFADGTSLSFAEVLGEGFFISGTADGNQLSGTNLADTVYGGAGADTINGGRGDDVLYGEDGDDRLDGGAGDDTLYGAEGNDILNGGAGDDLLSGGAGSDVYLFSSGFGNDTVIDNGAEQNVLRFDPWLTVSALQVTRNGDGLAITVKATSDTVVVKDFYTMPDNWIIQFGEGDTASVGDVFSQTDQDLSVLRQMWDDKKLAVTERLQHERRHVYDPVLGWVATTYQGLTAVHPSGTNAYIQVVHETAATNYVDWTTGNVVSSAHDVLINSRTITNLGMVDRDFTHYALNKVNSNESVIVNNSTSYTEVSYGSAVATLALGPKSSVQSTTWDTVGSFQGPNQKVYAVHTHYEWTSYVLNASVRSYAEGTAGWIGGYNQVIGDKVALEYRRTDTYETLLTEIVAGDADNEIHANMAGVELVDGGAGSDTIRGGAGDLLYGGSGDDVIYGHGSTFSVFQDVWGDWTWGWYGDAHPGVTMIGGEGSDKLYGSGHGNRYVILSADEGRVDLIEDSGSVVGLVKEIYARQLGENPDTVGKWFVGLVEWPGGYSAFWEETEESALSRWNDFSSDPSVSEYLSNTMGVQLPLSFEEAIRLGLVRSPTASQLPQFMLTSHPWLLEQFSTSSVELPPGIAAHELSFSWGTVISQDGKQRTTLDVAWHGAERLRIAMPREDDPLGWGVGEIQGSGQGGQWGLGMSYILRWLAPPMPGLQAGNDGENIFFGGENDLMVGGAGNDLYVINRGDWGLHEKTIVDMDGTFGNVDTLLFGAGITPADLQFQNVGDSLRISYGTGAVTLSHWFASDWKKVEQVRFWNGTSFSAVSSLIKNYTGIADNITWGVDELKSRMPGMLTDQDDVATINSETAVLAGAGNDVLDGAHVYDAVIDGGAGDDVISILESWNNTYLISKGGGNDVIRLSSVYGQNALCLTNVLPDEISVHLTSDNHLLIMINETGEVTTVENWGNFIWATVMKFADGSVWGGYDIRDYAQATGVSTEEADYLVGRPAGDQIAGLGGDDILIGKGGDDILDGGSGDDSLHGDDGNDILEGGKGNDYLDGGEGNDIYIFSRGDGLDWIFSRDDTPSKQDVIRFKSGITATDLQVARRWNELILKIIGTKDQITVDRYFDEDQDGFTPYRIEQIQFEDGSPAWRHADLERRIPTAITLEGGDGDDQLFGGTGSDTLIGGKGNDTLLGGDGYDYLEGNAGNDILAGGADDDSLDGGDGNDTLDGGEGNDYLDGGEGNDVYLFGRDDGQDWISSYDTTLDKQDVIRLKAGITATDVRVMRQSNDLILRISGTTDQITVQDYFYNEGQNNAYGIEHIQFEDGSPAWSYADVASRLPVAIILEGSNGDDQLLGGTGDDILTGGAGNDLLDGGDGDDTYVFHAGDGIDHIVDSGGADTLVFDGMSVGDISLGLGSLRIRYGADEVHIEVFNPEEAENSGAIEQFVFDDGILSYEGLLALGFDIKGGGNIAGTSVADRIKGGDGDDTIRGGRGDDVLSGGAGNDTYILNAGDGNDTIIDAALPGSGNRIRFGAGIGADTPIFTEQADGVLIRYGANDAVFLQGAGHVADVLSRIEFSDGSVLDFAQAGNLAPLPSVALAAQVAEQGASFSFVIPQEAFVDPEGEPLSLSLSLADGGALPTWLSFDPFTRTLSGTPGNGDIGALQLTLTAIDPAGATAIQTFGLNVLDGNAAPALTQSIATQWATEDFAFSYTLPVGAFADADGDALGYQITLANGDPLPSWLAFNPATRTLVGTPPNTTAGMLSLQVSATDPGGLSATTVFTLDIANHIVGNGDENTLTGTALRDHIEGRGDDDVLYGGAGDDYLDGGRGEDTLYGGAGNDTLYGGISDDDDDDDGSLLIGGTGDDTYIIDRASPQIREYAGEGIDTVKSSISYTLGSHLENLELTGTANRNGTGNALNNRLTGNSGNNTLNGGGGNDTLDGGVGADILIGGSGSDTYLLGRGYGSDTIQENDGTAGNTDVARFLEGIATDQLWFRHVGNNLEVSIIGTGDRFTIQNWYTGNAYHVEQFRTADGQILLDSQVENLVQAMAAFAPPAAGQTSLPPAYQAALSPVLAANWQ